ncbi:MAG TPA: ribose 5-phosphate isomerase B [Rickettsiales bacterium]|nr:ribose 5-phosphate isomerase B [Rickettsiales bacterium]
MSKNKKIAIAADHAGFDLKTSLIANLVENGYEVEDLGCNSAKIPVDYPDFAFAVSKKISTKQVDFAVLICGSGIGISIAANREKQVRAALCVDENMAKLARLHNDANVICFGARLIDKDRAAKTLQVFLNTEFEGKRHEARIKKMS